MEEKIYVSYDYGGLIMHMIINNITPTVITYILHFGYQFNLHSNGPYLCACVCVCVRVYVWWECEEPLGMMISIVVVYVIADFM